MKRPGLGRNSWLPLEPGDLVRFDEEPLVYVVLRRYFSDRYLDDIVEVLTPDGCRMEFFEDYLVRV